MAWLTTNNKPALLLGGESATAKVQVQLLDGYVENEEQLIYLK